MMVAAIIIGSACAFLAIYLFMKVVANTITEFKNDYPEDDSDLIEPDDYYDIF